MVDACFAVLGLQIQKEMETEILNVSGSRISHRLTQISQASKEFLKMSKEPERTGKNRDFPTQLEREQAQLPPHKHSDNFDFY